jgi:hypothetical protein
VPPVRAAARPARPFLALSLSEAVAGLSAAQLLALAHPLAEWRAYKLPLKSVAGFREQECSTFCVSWSGGGSMAAVGTSENTATVFALCDTAEADALALLGALLPSAPSARPPSLESLAITGSEPNALVARACMYRSTRLDGHVNDVT